MVKGSQPSVSPRLAGASKASDKLLFLRVHTDHRPVFRFVDASQFGYSLELLVAKFAVSQRKSFGDASSSQPQSTSENLRDHTKRERIP